MDTLRVYETQLQEAAQRYRGEGYDVILEPKGEQLPDFLAAYRPDMLVRKNNEFIVVEVKTRASLAHSNRMQELARTIQEHPGWKLELILANSSYLTREELERSLGAQDIARVTKEVATLLEANLNEPALLFAWSAVEAALRLLAFKEDIVLEKRGPNYLLERLTTEGVISREDYQTLLDTLKLRNEVAHGFRVEPEDVSREQVQHLLETVQHIMNDQSNSHFYLLGHVGLEP